MKAVRGGGGMGVFICCPDDPFFLAGEEPWRN